jgi:hypothetical protein
MHNRCAGRSLIERGSGSVAADEIIPPRQTNSAAVRRSKNPSLPALPFTEGAAVITGTGWRRGGGPATWARWSMARASASTLDGARGLSARTVSITPPPGHYESGAGGLHRRSERSGRRAVSDRTAAWRTSRTKNRAGRQATGIPN